MCTGVTKGCAGVKLSGSLKMYGSFRVNSVSYLLVRSWVLNTINLKTFCSCLLSE